MAFQRFVKSLTNAFSAVCWYCDASVCLIVALAWASVCWLAGVIYDHHSLSHHGQDPEKLKQLAIVELDKMQALRDRWDEQTRGLNQGKTPILTSGLKPQPWGMTAKDAELAEIMKLSEQHIALAFRIPLQIFGLGGAGTGSTGYNSTEALMHSR